MLYAIASISPIDQVYLWLEVRSPCKGELRGTTRTGRIDKDGWEQGSRLAHYGMTVWLIYDKQS